MTDYAVHAPSASPRCGDDSKLVADVPRRRSRPRRRAVVVSGDFVPGHLGRVVPLDVDKLDLADDGVTRTETAAVAAPIR